MSTNKTQNYQLHGWAFGDELPRTELNANFTKLDTALKDEATARAAAAQNEAAARASAVATLNTAIGRRAEIVVGTYAGNYDPDTYANAVRTISLGFTPRALFLTQYGGLGPHGQNCVGGIAIQGFPVNYASANVVEIVTGGFTVRHNVNNYTLNYKGSTYRYLAVK